MAKLRHIALSVPDPEKSADFYCAAFDMERVGTTDSPLAKGCYDDRAMTEPMTNEDGIEPIYDRSKEHLATTDSMVIMARRMIIKAARVLREQGVAPANVDNVALDAVRSTSIVLPPNADWIKESEQGRSAAPSKEVVYVAMP